jgi:hypothetical protein
MSAIFAREDSRSASGSRLRTLSIERLSTGVTRSTIKVTVVIRHLDGSRSQRILGLLNQIRVNYNFACYQAPIWRRSYARTASSSP